MVVAVDAWQFAFGLDEKTFERGCRKTQKAKEKKFGKRADRRQNNGFG
jgi:hypothetical protein